MRFDGLHLTIHPWERSRTTRKDRKEGTVIQHQGLKLAYVSAAANAVIVGFSFLFVKIALESAAPMDVLAWRFAVSFAVLSLPVLFGKIQAGFRGRPLHRLLLLAAFYPLGFFLFQTYGLQHAASAEAGILNAFVPVLILLLASVFLKEPASGLQRISVGLSVAGVVFIYWMKGSDIDLSNLTGILLLTGSSAAFAGYSVLARSLLKSFRPVELTWWTLGMGFVIFAAMSGIEHASNGTWNELFAPLRDARFIMSVLYLSILSSLVTAFTANYALSRLQAAKAGVFTNLSTVVAIAAGALILGEAIEMYHLVGSLMIIAGVWGTNRPGKRPGKRPEKRLEKRLEKRPEKRPDSRPEPVGTHQAAAARDVRDTPYGS